MRKWLALQAMKLAKWIAANPEDFWIALKTVMAVKKRASKP